MLWKKEENVDEIQRDSRILKKGCWACYYQKNAQIAREYLECSCPFTTKRVRCPDEYYVDCSELKICEHFVLRDQNLVITG